MRKNVVESVSSADVPKPMGLKERMAANPKAFDFPKAPDSVIGSSQVTPLAVMLGGFEYAGADMLTGQKFYFRKPKLKQLTELLDLIGSPSEGEGKEKIKASLYRSAEACSLLLYVRECAGWRSATVEEIGAAFDPDELTAFIEKWSGLKAATAGEAGVQS